MGSVITKQKSILPNNDNPRKYCNVYERDVYNQLASESLVNPSIMRIAENVAEFFSEIPMSEGVKLIDLILCDAIAEWNTRYAEEGHTKAYKAFCISVFKALPIALTYRVVGRKGIKPNANGTWDAAEMGLVKWLEVNKIDAVHVERVVSNSKMSSHEVSLLLCRQIFNRADMEFFGLEHVCKQEKDANAL